MNDPTQLNSVPLLNGENWKEWFFRMENHLRLNGLWDVTKSEPTKDEIEKSGKYGFSENKNPTMHSH